jgi:hypothetical protein
VRGGRYLVTLAAAGMLATGCGTTVAGTQSPAGTLAAAVTKTGTQTARIAVTVSVKSTGMSMSFDITGAFDFAHSRGMLTMGAPIGLTELFIAPKAYIKFSGGSGPTLPNGKSWFEVDATGLPADASSPLGALGTTGNPKDLLTSLTAIAGSEQKLGTGTVRGVPATEYQLNIDPAKTEAKVPSAERASVGKFFQSLGKGTLPVDVWLDGQNLVRRVQLSLRLPGGSGALGMSGNPQLTVTMDFYDYGAPVNVSAPPANQVASTSQMFASSGVSVGSESGGPEAAPPKVSGSLTSAQAAGAEQAAAAFWAALGHNDPAAIARTVLPAQRSCISSVMGGGGPKFTVSSYHAVSAQPAGNGKATVRFTVNAKASLGGQDVPVFAGTGGVQWLVAVQSAGHWYVDVNTGSDFTVTGMCQGFALAPPAPAQSAPASPAQSAG